MSNATIASRPDATLSLAEPPPNSAPATYNFSPEPNPEKEKKVQIAFRDKATLVTLARLLPFESHVCRKCHWIIARNLPLLISHHLDFHAFTP